MKDRAGRVETFAAGDIADGIRGRLAAVIRAIPDEVAIDDDRGETTFAQLAADAAAVAEAIAAEGPREAHEPVAMLCGHDAGGVATLLGVLLSGHPLLVLDTRTPAARSAERLTHLGAGTVVADAGASVMAGDIAHLVSGRVIAAPTMERTRSDAAASTAWTRPLDPSRVASLGFTSGSTGVPKIVALDHRHLAGDAWAGSTLDDCIGPDDIVGHALPLAFAAGFNTVLAALTAGARTVLFDPRQHGIAPLADRIVDAGITSLHVSPAMLRAFGAAHPDPDLLSGVRVITLAGEAAHSRDAAVARSLLPGRARLFHRYGSTETGLIAHLVTPLDADIPEGRLGVGAPVGLARVRLVDAGGNTVHRGDVGTVEVTRDEYLASGYWRDESRTRAQFTDHPDGSRSYLSNDLAYVDEEGRLCMVGRRDHSVKIRGYLVEPGEVDAALFALPDVADAVTVGVPRADGAGNRLVAYVVSRAERPAAAPLRAALRGVIPAYMVPETFVFLDALPRTERDKVDRAALPEPPAPVVGEPPRTEWETVVAGVWARALELDDISRDADFFELGGDSLAAEAVVSMMLTDLGVPPGAVSAATLVEAPTLAEFAHRARRCPPRHGQTLTTLRSEGDEPPLFLMAGGGGLGVSFVPIVRHLPPGRPVHALHAHGLERRGIPDWSVRAMARRHLASIRRIQPHGPYHLGGHSFGGVVAFEMAHRLVEAGEEVALLAIIDSFPPDPAALPPMPERSLARRLRDGVGLAVTGLVPTPGLGQYWRFHRQSRFLSDHYRGAPYAGRTLVLVADSPERASRAAWAPFLTGCVDVVDVVGDHQSILREPHARGVAEAIGGALATATAARGHLLAAGSPGRGSDVVPAEAREPRS